MSGDREDPERIGSVGEEAAKLLGALSDWAKDAAGDAAHGLDQRVSEHLATGAAECTYCPICRTVHAVRGMSPEVKEQLATAATTFLQTAASVLVARGTAPGAREGVQHIDLDDEGEWPEEGDS